LAKSNQSVETGPDIPIFKVVGVPANPGGALLEGDGGGVADAGNAPAGL
jgi:hypothetical protein|tara:strand:- start:372 stop:518 length:147 start_codon:yes stop_codon:yes gene_type:complete